MSLPWFAFNIKDFVSNTLRLNTEAKGAYLMLILDYYQTETAPPDDDEVLAAITGLPLAAWQRHRRVIAPLFEIKDGVWLHERIRDELRNGHEKHSAKVARTAAATAAAAAKRNATKSVTDTVTDKKRTKSKPPSVTDSVTDTVKETVRPSVTDTQTQTQKDVGGGECRAGATPASVTDIEDGLTGSAPADLGVPIDLWKPEGVDPADIEHLNRFFAHHIEEGTFSRDWPSLWRSYLDRAKAPPSRRRGKPNVLVNKLPEPIPGRRSLISQEAKDLAGEVERVMGVEGHPMTVGLPMLLETWLSGWPGEVILTTIQQIMAQRTQRGEGPPSTMKYFEIAISRAVAELTRPLPVTTLTAPKEITAHANPRRQKGQSVSDAAGRLAEQFAALTGGGTGDGALEGEIVGRAIQEE